MSANAGRLAVRREGAVGWLLFVLARRWFGDRPRAEVLALLAAALYLFNPVTWYDSAIWGQVDGIGALLWLATVYCQFHYATDALAGAVLALAALIAGRRAGYDSPAAARHRRTPRNGAP